MIDANTHDLYEDAIYKSIRKKKDHVIGIIMEQRNREAAETLIFEYMLLDRRCKTLIKRLNSIKKELSS
jgi:hypothetical protein